MGAEIILIESRTRRIQRVTPPFAFGRPGFNTGARFNTLNHNKLGCTLNLRAPKAIALVKRLVAMSDAVVENFSAGTMEKLGLGYETLRDVNPNVVYLSASAFGRTGAWRDYVGYHSTVNAFSGLAQITGYPGGAPRLLGAVLPDTIGGMYITLALLVALYHRRQTGEGRYIDFSMLEGLLTLMPQPVIDYTLNGREWERVGNRDVAKAPHGTYRSSGSDAWVSISVGSQGEFEALCRVAGHPEWPSDPRFRDEWGRLTHQAELDQLIEEWTCRQTPDDVARRLQAVGVAAGPARSVSELVNDPHLRARGFMVQIDHPEAGQRMTPGLPWKSGDKDARDYGRAPLIGEHNDYVFKELLGLSSTEVEALVAEGVIE
jgi:benzylsuccinate CoA-transferase BbsF subunit